MKNVKIERWIGYQFILATITSIVIIIAGCDKGGNDQTSTISLDTQPPTQPTNLQAITQSPTSISLSWSASTDNVGVVGYKIYRDLQTYGTETASTINTFYVDNNLELSTSYTYTILSYDAAGNESIKSTITATTEIQEEEEICQTQKFTEVALGQEILDLNSCNESIISSALFTLDENNNILLTLNIYPTSASFSEAIFSYGFYLIYDPNIIQFIEYIPGEFLGSTTIAQTELNGYDEKVASLLNSCDEVLDKKIIVIGHSLIGQSVAGNIINITGDLLGKLKFKVKDSSAP